MGVVPTKPRPKETYPSVAVKTALETGRSGFGVGFFHTIIVFYMEEWNFLLCHTD